MEIGDGILGDPTTDGIITYLQGKNILASTKTCTCGVQMNLGTRRDISDGKIFRCSTCKTTKSLRHGSFIDKSNIPFKKWMVLIYW